MAKKKKNKKQAGPPRGPRTVATNRKARHDYHIIETFEAGIALTGTEIKSVRAGQVNLRDGFVMIRDGEAWLMNVHIAPYEHGNRANHEETRRRKLLLHRREINELHGAATQKGWTIVPLRMYINEAGRAKVEIALVRGKQQFDKRRDIAKRDAERDIKRALKQAYT
ncbi:MAG: SsrA-binding protein SmpB [Caldilineae bacterium]|nr:MAG: SsrA-binding protein SmpB [Caldilineae bacterium]